MPIITFDKFDLGMDRRKDREIADANRLYLCENAFITTGYAVQKRAGLPIVQVAPANTFGLYPGLGRLNVFTTATPGPLTPLIRQHQVLHPTNTTQGLKAIHFADVFQGFLYVVAEYQNGDIYHHYLDGTTPTAITDTNNPRSKAVTFAKSKVYAVGNEVVNYSATNKPRDWTTANDAGALPSGIQATGDPNPLGLGHHRGRLAIIHRDAVQTWNVDPNPANNSFVEEVDNSGSRYPRTLSRVAGDLFFLSNGGFRSISQLQFNQSLSEIDIGSPIDSLVLPASKSPAAEPHATYFDTQNQYLCAIGRTIYAFHFSKTAKVSAWQQYQLPANVEHFAEHENEMYLKLADGNIYRLDPSVFADNGAAYPVVVETQFLDFKQPTKFKFLHAFDCELTGNAEVEFLYDERDPSLVVGPMTVQGLTRAGELYPCDLVTVSVAVRFRNTTTTDFKLKSFSFHYDVGEAA